MSENWEQSIAVVIDDNEVFRNRLCRALTDRGWLAYPAEDAISGMAKVSEQHPDLVTVDLRLPGESGLEIIRQIREIDPDVFILMLTGYGSIATALSATKLGADHYLTKPADADQILKAYETMRQLDPVSIDPDSQDATVPSLARVEWEHIQRVLEDCDGNVSQAARLLGLHRRSLQRKLMKYPPAQ